MKKIILTGASGFLGWHLAQSWQLGGEAVGLYYRQQFEGAPWSWERINLLRDQELRELLDRLAPDAIIHAAAIANSSFCEEHPALSYHVNVYASLTLADYAKARGIPFLFVSSDMVFNGHSAPYDEDSFAYPLLQYGSQKLAVEEALLADYPNAYICRLPLLLGIGPAYSKHFFGRWLAQLADEEGEQLAAFSDEYRTPLSAYEAARYLQQLLALIYYNTEEKLPRIWHFPGPERLSRLALAQKMAHCFGLDAHKILAASLADIQPARPEDLSMQSLYAAKYLNYSPLSLAAQLEEIAAKS